MASWRYSLGDSLFLTDEPQEENYRKRSNILDLFRIERMSIEAEQVSQIIGEIVGFVYLGGQTTRGSAYME